MGIKTGRDEGGRAGCRAFEGRLAAQRGLRAWPPARRKMQRWGRNCVLLQGFSSRKVLFAQKMRFEGK